MRIGGGFNDKEDLPFNKALSPKEALKMLGKVIKPNVLKKYQSRIFKGERGYNTHYRALQMVAERYEFYLKVLQREPKVMKEFGKAIGEKEREARVAYAIHSCIVHGERFVKDMEEMLREFPVLCLEKVCIEEQGGRVILDMPPPISTYEATGVMGSEPPYMSGGRGDDTMLLQDEETADKNFQEGVRGLEKACFGALKD